MDSPHYSTPSCSDKPVFRIRGQCQRLAGIVTARNLMLVLTVKSSIYLHLQHLQTRVSPWTIRVQPSSSLNMTSSRTWRRVRTLLEGCRTFVASQAASSEPKPTAPLTSLPVPSHFLLPQPQSLMDPSPSERFISLPPPVFCYLSMLSQCESHSQSLRTYWNVVTAYILIF